MASFFLAPDPIQSTFFVPGGAIPGSGVQLFIYVAGSVSTKTTVYKDNAGNAAWTNPIVMDSGGNLPNGGVVWIPAGVSIKAVWAPANDTDPPTSPYRTIDNMSGVNDTTSAQTEWIVGPTPTFVSGSQFTLVGDQTLIFTKSRRLKFTVTAGTVYGAISSVSFGGVTTVNVAFASGALDAGLSAVSYSLIAPDNPSINADYVNKQASSVASSGNGTTNIWGIAGNYVHVTGTNSVFNFSSAPYPGAQRTVIFDGALSLNSSAALTMFGNANVTTAANDRANVYADTATSAIVSFYRQSGIPLISPQVSGTVFAGPSSGAAAQPAFRALVPSDLSMTPISNSLANDVALLSTTTYFDGPTVAQGTTGTWLAMGTVSVNDVAGSASIHAKLHDGTTIKDSAVTFVPSINQRTSISLSGVFSSPAGNIRISVKDLSSASGTILASTSGSSTDSTITAIRIA